jgi:LysM repeat protein
MSSGNHLHSQAFIVYTGITKNPNGLEFRGGKVVEASINHPSYGKYCKIRTGTTDMIYAHMKDIGVKVGQVITTAPVIKPTYYVVKSGDTLGAIAKKFNTTVAQLAKWNGIRDVNKISVGQRLKVR